MQFRSSQPFFGVRAVSDLSHRASFEALRYIDLSRIIMPCIALQWPPEYPNTPCMPYMPTLTPRPPHCIQAYIAVPLVVVVSGVDCCHVQALIKLLPGALKTMKNQGFHIHMPCVLLGKIGFLMVCGAPGCTWTLLDTYGFVLVHCKHRHTPKGWSVAHPHRPTPELVCSSHGNPQVDS